MPLRIRDVSEKVREQIIKRIETDIKYIDFLDRMLVKATGKNIREIDASDGAKSLANILEESGIFEQALEFRNVRTDLIILWEKIANMKKRF